MKADDEVLAASVVGAVLSAEDDWSVEVLSAARGVCEADGHIDPAEEELIRSLTEGLLLDPGHENRLLSVEELTQRLLSRGPVPEEIRDGLITVALLASYADGGQDEREKSAIRRLAKAMGLEEAHLDEIDARVRQQLVRARILSVLKEILRDSPHAREALAGLNLESDALDKVAEDIIISTR
jgi:tellurite resistance protein